MICIEIWATLITLTLTKNQINSFVFSKMSLQEVVLLSQLFEEMDSSSSEDDNDDDDDLLFLAHLMEEVCETETHAKIRRYIDDVVSQYSDFDVSTIIFV